MKTNFQQYNSKSDEELIELSMGNSVDASMSHAVLEYRKYLQAKRQTKLSFALATLAALMTWLRLRLPFSIFESPIQLFTQLVQQQLQHLFPLQRLQGPQYLPPLQYNSRLLRQLYHT